MSLTARVLTGLGAGLAAGILLASVLPGSAPVIASWVEPAGLIWVNALRMTVIPLVFAGLVAGAAGAQGGRSLGGLGLRAATIFLVLLAAATTFTVTAGRALLALLPLDPAAAAGLRESAGQLAAPGSEAVPGFRDWLLALVPTNVVQAAAAGSILPLIVFAVLFGLALARTGEAHRDRVVPFFRGVFSAMLTLVRWILELAPAGVFALALPLASRLGLAAAGAVGYYILVVVTISTLFILLLYPVVALFGRTGTRAFARGAAPAQAVAFSARSSLAALPAMIQGGERHLAFPAIIEQFFLPLSASTFRLGGAIGIPAGVLFVARLYDVPLAPVQLATIALTSLLLTFSIPGVPGGAILVMMPVLHAVGLPPQAAGILLGVDTIPDMFRTTANVTGTMAAATILARRERSAGAPPAAPGEAAAAP